MHSTVLQKRVVATDIKIRLAVEGTGVAQVQLNRLEARLGALNGILVRTAHYVAAMGFPSLAEIGCQGGRSQSRPTPEQIYMFERPITFHHGDGSSSAGRVDCYRLGHFVLESIQLPRRTY